MKKLFCAASSLLLLGAALGAQDVTTGFFLDHYNYAYRLNPAFQPDADVKSTFGILVDNVTVSSATNLGLNSLLFPVDGKLVSGLNKNVPADLFLNGLLPDNKLNEDISLNILTVGFRTDPGGFGSIEANIRSNTYANLPKSMFEFLKLGSKDGTNLFNVKNIDLQSDFAFEFAFGYSHKIGRRVSVGGRAKLLLGLARAAMNVSNMDLILDNSGGTSTLGVTALGSMSLCSPLISLGTKVVEGEDIYDLSKIGMGKFGLGGFGVAFDLGVTVEPIDDLVLSAAVTDLGFINWKKSTNAIMDYSEVYELSTEELSNADFTKLLNFKAGEAGEKFKETLPFNVRVGAKYSMPFYKNLSVGVLGTFTITDFYKYNEVRVGATVTPIKHISLTANYAYSNYGHAMGAAINFNLGPVELFAATDSVIFQYTPQGVPITKLNTAVTAGLLFQIKNKVKSL